MLIIGISRLVDTLAHHSVSHLHEAGDVSALHVVDVAAGFSTVFNALFVDALHDVVKFSVNFLDRKSVV